MQVDEIGFSKIFKSLECVCVCIRMSTATCEKEMC